MHSSPAGPYSPICAILALKGDESHPCFTKSCLKFNVPLTLWEFCLQWNPKSAAALSPESLRFSRFLTSVTAATTQTLSNVGNALAQSIRCSGRGLSLWSFFLPGRFALCQTPSGHVLSCFQNDFCILGNHPGKRPVIIRGHTRPSFWPPSTPGRNSQRVCAASSVWLFSFAV